MSDEADAGGSGTTPRGSGRWPRVRRIVRRARSPVDRFLALESASGIVLMIASAAALLWANSPARASYHELLHWPVALALGPFRFERDLHFWINDGLMTVFFFVIGLEIRREVHDGELRDLPRAALPLIAALGGMLVPAAIYVALNHERTTARGWAIPMATDIAFAVGVLSLLGARVAAALRVFLLALAVIDDIGAIVVIALAYSGDLVWRGALVALGGALAIVALRALRVRRSWAYLPAGVVLWAGTLVLGVHPTLAGVAAGLLMNDQRLERRLHAPVAYGIMPLFALANAGVAVGSTRFDGDAPWAFAGIAAGLLLGKPLGVLAACWLGARTGIARLPEGAGPLQLTVVGCVAGIGFTMALFVAQLAFPSGPLLEVAKLAVLSGSALSALLGLLLGARLPARGGSGDP